MKKVVRIIAIIYSVISLIAFVVCFIMLFGGQVWTSLLSMVSLVVNLILLWAFYFALDRIDDLEEDVAELKQLQETKDKENKRK